MAGVLIVALLAFEFMSQIDCIDWGLILPGFARVRFRVDGDFLQ
jgi:hypothetical protein